MIVQHFYVNSTEKREKIKTKERKAESWKPKDNKRVTFWLKATARAWTLKVFEICKYLFFLVYFFAHEHQVHVCMTLGLSCPGTEWFKCSGSHQLRAIGMHKYQKLWCFNIVKYCCLLDLSALCSFHQLQTVARCHRHYHVYTHSHSHSHFHSPFLLWSALVSHWPICMEIVCIWVLLFVWLNFLFASTCAIYLAAFGFCLSCKFDASSSPMDASLNSHGSV